MKTGFAFPHLKRNFYDRIQGRTLLGGVVARGVEAQSINSGNEFRAIRNQLRTASIMIGVGGGQQPPLTGRIPDLKTNRYTTGGLAENNIQNVGGNSFHNCSHVIVEATSSSAAR